MNKYWSNIDKMSHDSHRIYSIYCVMLQAVSHGSRLMTLSIIQGDFSKDRIFGHHKSGTNQKNNWKTFKTMKFNTFCSSSIETNAHVWVNSVHVTKWKFMWHMAFFLPIGRRWTISFKRIPKNHRFENGSVWQIFRLITYQMRELEPPEELSRPHLNPAIFHVYLSFEFLSNFLLSFTWFQESLVKHDFNPRILNNISFLYHA